MLFGWLLLGCGNKEAECALDEDCPNGACSVEGVCVDLIVDSADTASDTDDTGEDIVDTGDTELCIPNHDGVMTAEEYPLQLNLPVPFVYTENATVDLVGRLDNGQTVWDWSVALSGDENISVVATEIGDYWFADDFSNSSYVAILSYSNELYGIFTRTEDALYLDGVASFEEGWSSTLLTYDPPAKLIQWPFEVGSTWTTQSTVSGTLNGVWSYHTETQSMNVDKNGQLSTALGTFPVLRLHTYTERQVGILTYTSHSMAFAAECYGIVTTAASTLDEPEKEFTQALELLRMRP